MYVDIIWYVSTQRQVGSKLNYRACAFYRPSLSRVVHVRRVHWACYGGAAAEKKKIASCSLRLRFISSIYSHKHSCTRTVQTVHTIACAPAHSYTHTHTHLLSSRHDWNARHHAGHTRLPCALALVATRHTCIPGRRSSTLLHGHTGSDTIKYSTHGCVSVALVVWTLRIASVLQRHLSQEAKARRI